jgi:N-acetylneuraminic acid mutarotase
MANNLGTNEEYDPKADVWATRRRLPTPRSGVAAAALGGRLYVLGGESPPKTFDENEEYDPVSDAWTARTRMPSPRHGLAAVALGDSIYVLAGGPTPGGSESPLNQVFTV